MEQEPRHTSTCTLNNENSSDDSSANKGFIFPLFLLPWLMSSPRGQITSARKLLWGFRERGSIPWERCGSKGAHGCCSKVKWINLNLVHSRSWLFYFEKVSAHFFRLPLGLSSLIGSMCIPAETRAHKGRQGWAHACLLAASLPATFPIRDSAWPIDTALLAEPLCCSSAMLNTA